MKLTLSMNSILLPLLVLAFAGVSVTFLAPFFTTTTRWLVLVVAILYAVASGRVWRPLRTRFAIITLLSGMWGVATIIWSELPVLSAAKSIAFIMVSLTSIIVGYNWSLQTTPEKALDFLMPLTASALAAGLLGRFSAHAVDYAGTANELYQGLVAGGPNMFGSMLAMCSPYLLWKLYYNWGHMKWRLFWLLLSAIAAYYLVRASSRGAMLIVLITAAGLVLSLGVGKRVQISIMTIVGLAVLFMALPEKFEELQQKLIYKNSIGTQGVFYTREQVWKISYEKALEGGWFGGGYGVSIGDRTGKKYVFALTAVDYGREKGNSQLAIIEESGLIGLALYAVSLFFLFLRLINAARRWPSGEGRVMMSITTALLLGMLAGSCFEAWWVAPGAPESTYFWLMTGVALGLSATRPVPVNEVRPMSMKRARLAEAHKQGLA